VHFGKLPCLRRETLGRLEAGAVTSCGLFDLQRSLDETDAIVTGQACSEVRNHVRMRREAELLDSGAPALETGSLISSIAGKRVIY
jgi:hypothetical protein